MSHSSDFDSSPQAMTTAGGEKRPLADQEESRGGSKGRKRRLVKNSDISPHDEHVVIEKTKSPRAVPVQPAPAKSKQPSLVQPSIMSMFSAGPSASKPSITSSVNSSGTAAKSSAPVAAGQIKTTFGRSNKTMVKSRPSAAKPAPAPKPIEFDDDDDDFIIVGESVADPVSTPAAIVVPKSKSPSPVNNIMSKEVVMIDDEEAETPAKVTKKHSTPKTSSAKAKQESAATKREPVEEAEPADTPGEKKKNNYFSMVAKRGGPLAQGSKPLPVGRPNCLAGLSFVFTGEMDSTSREDAVDLVKRYGGRVVGAPSSRTDYVVVGREPGESKLRKIEQLKLKTLDEDTFFELIEKQPGKEEPSSTNTPSAAKQATKTPAKKKAKVEPLPVAEPSSLSTDSSSKYVSDLWTVKYAPRSFADIVGNKSHCENLAKWLNQWNNSRQAGFKGVGKDNAAGFRAALLSGPPGIGKTTAAHLVAARCGYEVIEMNASDARNKSSLDTIVKELTGSHTIGEYFKPKSVDGKAKEVATPKNHCIVMDEVDGMGGGDRGGMAELIQLIKKTKVPIICICNDRQSPKVRSLANYCLDLRFSRPSALMVRARLTAISQQEGIDVEPNALDQLVAITQSDIRQILNILQTYKLKNSSLNYDESKTIGLASKKNVDMGPFDLVGRLLGGSVFRGLSMEDKMSLYFSDYQLVPPMVQENYIRMKPWAKPGLTNPNEIALHQFIDISNAAESISNSDLVEGLIYGRQEFSLMPVHAMMSSIIPATHIQGNMGERLAFPSILGQISKANKGWRLLKELHLHMRLHVSSNKLEIRQSYMPALLSRLTVPLVNQGATAIEGVIAMMDEYYLNKEDWDAIVELSLGPWSGDNILKKIPTAVKSAFTRTYNKTAHQTPFTIVSAKSMKVTAASKSVKVDLEDAIELDNEDDDDTGDAEDDDMTADKMIKPKTKSKSTAKSKASTSKAKAAPRKKTTK